VKEVFNLVLIPVLIRIHTILILPVLIRILIPVIIRIRVLILNLILALLEWYCSIHKVWDHQLYGFKTQVDFFWLREWRLMLLD
jgi:hypothetical protein